MFFVFVNPEGEKNEKKLINVNENVELVETGVEY